VRVETSLIATAAGLNAFATVGAAIVVRSAVLLTGPAAPVSVVLAPEVVFEETPAAAVITLKASWQVVAGNVIAPPARLTVPEPDVPPVTVPPQVLATFGPPRRSCPREARR
jgi:hypothetical protein